MLEKGNIVNEYRFVFKGKTKQAFGVDTVESAVNDTYEHDEYFPPFSYKKKCL